MRRKIGILMTLALVLGIGLTVNEAAGSGPMTPDADATMIPVDLCLRAVRADADRPCVSFVDGRGRGWYIADIAGVHRSLRRLKFKPGQWIRVIGEACDDCLHPVCGEFAGFIFEARIVPCRRGDVNGDGETNTRDISAVLEAMGGCPDAPELCPADLTHDGTVDIDDLIIVLEQLGRTVRMSS